MNDLEFPTPALSTLEKLKQIQDDAIHQSLTEDQISKLEEAFLNQASDAQACFIAGISQQKLKRYEEINPNFEKRKEQLRSLVKYQAKKNITEKVMSGDVEISKWLADRVLKDEGYSTRQEHTGADGMPLIEIVSYKKQQQQALEGELDTPVLSSPKNTHEETELSIQE